MIDLDAYFSRIGYMGTREPTLKTLEAIHRLHVRTIPFENLDVLLGRGIRIDPVSIQRKLIHDRRGGYCFEQNQLLSQILVALGFRVTPLMARVRWQVPDGTSTPLTHVLLRVESEGVSHIADVGFGSMSLDRPLGLVFDQEQNVSLEPRRLVRRSIAPGAGGHEVSVIAQQARLGAEWSDIYQFTLEPASEADFEMGNWYTSTHPQSRFVQNLIASRIDDTHRCTLLNREFARRYVDGQVEKQTIESPEELLGVLASHFRLQFPPGTRFVSAGTIWPA
jgi:N-hydroxyarylamine O-acetyltransferase